MSNSLKSGIVEKMGEVAATHELVVWSDREHERLAGVLIEALGASWQVLGVAGPSSSSPVGLAESYSVRCETDLRSLVIDHPARALVVAASEPLSLDELAEATERCEVVVMTELVTTDLARLADIQQRLGDRMERIVHLPRFSGSPGMVSATEPLEVLGEPRLVLSEVCLRGGEGSLVTGLYHAWQVVLECQEMPEEVSASLVGGRVESPAQLRGSLAVTGKLSGRGASLIAVSDQTGLWERRVRLIGPEASLEVTDDDYRLLNATGEVVDSGGSGEPKRTQAGLIAYQLDRMLEGLSHGQNGSLELERVLACCEATLLSLRTGQPENPTKLMRLR